MNGGSPQRRLRLKSEARPHREGRSGPLSFATRPLLERGSVSLLLEWGHHRATAGRDYLICGENEGASMGVETALLFCAKFRAKWCGAKKPVIDASRPQLFRPLPAK